MRYFSRVLIGSLESPQLKDNEFRMRKKFWSFPKVASQNRCFRGVCTKRGRKWRNPLRCDYWVLVGSPEPKMVGFLYLVGSAYGPVSKNVAVKNLEEITMEKNPWSNNWYQQILIWNFIKLLDKQILDKKPKNTLYWHSRQIVKEAIKLNHRQR